VRGRFTPDHIFEHQFTAFGSYKTGEAVSVKSDFISSVVQNRFSQNRFRAAYCASGIISLDVCFSSARADENFHYRRSLPALRFVLSPALSSPPSMQLNYLAAVAHFVILARFILE
jgi:hypothetical protein